MEDYNNAALAEYARAANELIANNAKQAKRVEELEAEQQQLVYDCRDWRIKCEGLEAKLERLEDYALRLAMFPEDAGAINRIMEGEQDA